MVGDSLVRQAPDGSRTTVWSIWDDFEPADTELPAGPDWTHANAVDYLPERDLVLLGLRHFDSVLALDARSWQLQWALGGAAGTLELDPAQATLRQHQFQLHDDDRLLVFDNRLDPEDSRLSQYALNLDAGTAELEWSLHHDPPVRVTVLGNVERTPGERILATWSSAGEIQLLDEDGVVSWQLNTRLGTGVGYGDRFESF